MLTATLQSMHINTLPYSRGTPDLAPRTNEGVETHQGGTTTQRLRKAPPRDVSAVADCRPSSTPTSPRLSIQQQPHMHLRVFESTHICLHASMKTR
eukprot:6207129-Pleurochrysis_carterae.AAC.2